jgi:hypothetical protein
VKKNSGVIINLFLLSGIYITGIAIALFISEKIAVLPFNNPWGVVGLLTQEEYNPANDIIKFIAIITLPSIILAISFFPIVKKQKKVINTDNPSNANSADLSFETEITGRNKLFILSIIFVSIMALNIPTYHSSAKHADSFHEGESLGTAMSYMAGKIPYKETIFMHGIFQDPLRSVIAFKLFGKSIGSARTLESILKISSFILLFILLLKLFQQNYPYTYITFLILIFFCHSSVVHFPVQLLIPPRDVTTFLFIILFLSLRRSAANDENYSILKFTLVVFLFSFVPLASFSYSIDKGYYLSATFMLFSPVMLFFSMKKGLAKYYVISSILGLVSAAMLLGFLLKWDFYPFADFVFLKMPRYKELMDGIKYNFYDIRFLFPVAVIALNTYWITYNLLKELLKGNSISSSLLTYLKAHLIEICLLIMSIFYFRSALGRSDLEHVMYSPMLSYMLLAYIFIKYYLHGFLRKNKRVKKILIIFTIVSVCLLTTVGIYKTYDHKLLENNFPYAKDDSLFIPDNYKNAIAFIKGYLGENESFFTMTSEAIWYYYINKPCLSKFPVVWFAEPYFYQEQTVRDLKDNNVKLILYKNKHWANAIDGFTSQERLPIIDDYIRNHYSFFKTIDGNEFWIKNTK